MKMVRLVGAALAVAGLLALALSVTVAAADRSVSIKESNERYAYTPKSITVALGDTVTWTNDSDAPHTVDADDESFEHDEFDEGESVSETFDASGTFPYHCDVHDYMHGTVIVLAAGQMPPTDTAPAGSTGQGGSWILLLAFGLLALRGAFVIRRRMV
jgi:plastocyanin